MMIGSDFLGSRCFHHPAGGDRHLGSLGEKNPRVFPRHVDGQVDLGNDRSPPVEGVSGGPFDIHQAKVNSTAAKITTVMPAMGDTV